MRSRATPRFWVAYQALPADVKEKARRAFHVFRENPGHPSLRFKKVHATEPVYAVRVTRDFRAVGLLENDEIGWFWIGSHDEYDRLLAQL